MGVASQIDNRVFVGTPLCEYIPAWPLQLPGVTEREANRRAGRNQEYLDSVSQWAQRMAIGGQIVKLFPGFLKP